MSDFLLELSRNPQAKKLIKSLGLPIPMPQALTRVKGGYEERALKDLDVVIGGARSGPVADVLALTLAPAGANPILVGGDPAPYREGGEAYGRPPRLLDGPAPDDLRAGALVFDGTELRTPDDLRALYDFFSPWIARVDKSARIVVIGRPPENMDSPEGAAAQAALEGFVRSAAKEVGKRGATAQVVYVARGAESRLAPVLRFLLSPRSAFISGQPLRVTSRVKAPASMPFVRPLEGKVALVTGAARGIGEATARRLAEEGAHVICLDRPDDDGPVSQVAREIGGSLILADISDPTSPERIDQEISNLHGGLDIVVHNAGVTRDKTLARMSPDKWDQTVAINLTAVTRINERLLAGTLADHGRVVCLSSIAGIAGNMGQTNYAASKAGLIGYVRTLAERTADRGITVNAIAPGFIETRLTAAIPMVIREAGRRMSNLGQGGLPVDVAEAITFLSTPGSCGITGSVLRVCGGSMIGA